MVQSTEHEQNEVSTRRGTCRRVRGQFCRKSRMDPTLEPELVLGEGRYTAEAISLKQGSRNLIYVRMTLIKAGIQRPGCMHQQISENLRFPR